MIDDSPFDDDATPKQKPDVDVDSVSDPPSPDDFFLYSRVDGATTVRELCTTSGLGREQTLESLKRLCDVGLIDVPGYSPSTSGPGSLDERCTGEEADEADAAAGADEQDEGSAGGTAESESSGIDLSHLPIPPEEFEYDRELLEIDVPLDEELRRELICLSAQLDGLDHYQFFGVGRSASKGEIKRSYFELSKRYHPDKHFRKEIGPYEEMLEKIFQTITRAYRTLSNADKRAEYDDSLAARDAADATPMNKPSSVRMANEEADDEDSNEGDGRNAPGRDKRHAAFARLVKKGERHRKRQEYVEAAEQYRKALSLRRDRTVALRAARVLLQAETQLDQAELFAKAALEIDPENTEAQMLLGRALEKQGKREAAIECYDRVLELEPDHDKAEMRRKRLS